MEIIVYDYMVICNNTQKPFIGDLITFDFDTNKISVGCDIKEGWCTITNKCNRPIRLRAFDRNFISCQNINKGETWYYYIGGIQSNNKFLCSWWKTWYTY